MYPSRLFLAFLSLLACFCVACGAPGVVPWPDGAVMGDSRAEVAADASPPDASPDASPLDAVAVGDAAADQVAEASAPMDAPADAHDAVAVGDAQGDVPGLEVAADAAGDSSRDAADASDAPADPLAERVTAPRVTARAADYTWTMPVSQGCSIMGGTLSIGAEFMGAEPLTVTASGPLAGPVVLTVVGAGSDVRATVTRGAEYAAGGMNRANVRVRGMLPTELVLEVTALGCEVR